MTNWNHLFNDHTTFSLSWPAIGKGSVPRFFYLIDEYPNRTSTTRMQSYYFFLKVEQENSDKITFFSIFNFYLEI